MVNGEMGVNGRNRIDDTLVDLLEIQYPLWLCFRSALSLIEPAYWSGCKNWTQTDIRKSFMVSDDINDSQGFGAIFLVTRFAGGDVLQVVKLSGSVDGGMWDSEVVVVTAILRRMGKRGDRKSRLSLYGCS